MNLLHISMGIKMAENLEKLNKTTNLYGRLVMANSEISIVILILT